MGHLLSKDHKLFIGSESLKVARVDSWKKVPGQGVSLAMVGVTSTMSMGHLLSNSNNLTLVPDNGRVAVVCGARLGTVFRHRLVAVLDGGDVHHGVARCPRHLPRCRHGHLVARLHWHRLADGR